jgi:hypothetical protein
MPETTQEEVFLVWFDNWHRAITPDPCNYDDDDVDLPPAVAVHLPFGLKLLSCCLCDSKDKKISARTCEINLLQRYPSRYQHDQMTK